MVIRGHTRDALCETKVFKALDPVPRIFLHQKDFSVGVLEIELLLIISNKSDLVDNLKILSLNLQSENTHDQIKVAQNPH
jgi:hypothetical protein